MVVVSTLNAPCILRNFNGLIIRGLCGVEIAPPANAAVAAAAAAACDMGGAGALRGSLPPPPLSRAVRLDLLLGLNVGGRGEGLLVVRNAEGAVWLRTCGGMTGSEGRLDLRANNLAKKPIRGDGLVDELGDCWGAKGSGGAALEGGEGGGEVDEWLSESDEEDKVEGSSSAPSFVFCGTSGVVDNCGRGPETDNLERGV